MNPTTTQANHGRATANERAAFDSRMPREMMSAFQRCTVPSTLQTEPVCTPRFARVQADYTKVVQISKVPSFPTKRRICDSGAYDSPKTTEEIPLRTPR